MKEVLVERPTKEVALLRINRPDARNALNQEVRSQLASHFHELGQASDVRAIVLTGGDDVFAAGADIRAMVDCGSIEMMLRNTQRMWQMITACPKPIIAAVNGFAWGGGCELAMHADIIIAGETASFAQPEVKVGIMPGAGGTQRLLRAVGKFKALKMLLTGLPVSAQEASDMGLVSEVVADGIVQERAIEIATLIAALPPLAIAQIKEVAIAGMDASLETALMLERKAFQLLFASRDKSEGMQAFLEKRKPDFHGV
ncbi:enoyl-CoA hydratase [Ferribacterium limneticum]|uniref:enoyl-CoA hydratase n=1 Tax=Ferribacterium limneticum TaxID=76259 RepID=UPI001CFA91F3|nr:enoyl-CoA hydratase [Ferribacterium limneticum]UCV17764.1 enoyl-CoA hydratase [Ferribacterium limneticum]